jgi:hypothetical protein
MGARATPSHTPRLAASSPLLQEKALFLFLTDNAGRKSVLAPSSSLLKELHAAHADDDGFLYACYSSENTFG